MKPLYSKPILNDLALNIYSVDDSNDEITYGWSNDEKTADAKIEYDSTNDQAYFVASDGSKYYLDEFEKINEDLDLSNDDNSDKKASIYEALTDEDIESLSKLNLTEDELSLVLNLLELVVYDEKKTDAINIIKLLFDGKKLVPDEEQIEESDTEKYTRKLLGDI